MVEIFLNERRIILVDGDVTDTSGTGLTVNKVEDQAQLHDLVSRFLAIQHPDLTISGSWDWLWQAFLSHFILIRAAGGVVKSDMGYLFIFRRGYWDLPKGKIDKGETPEEAALREVREETGLTQLSITGVLPTTWHIYQSPWEEDEGKWILKETKWFLMTGNSEEPLIPEITEDIETAQWIPAHDLTGIITRTYPNLKTLTRLFVPG